MLVEEESGPTSSSSIRQGETERVAKDCHILSVEVVQYSWLVPVAITIFCTKYVAMYSS